MKIDIMTLFPDTVNAVLHESIIGRAANKGLVEINCHQIRDFTNNRQKQVDDYPYGGGWGCVMMAQPLKSCLDNIMSTSEGMKSRVIYMSPQGQTYNEEVTKRLVRDYDHLVLICGHYEGIDERFIQKCVDEEISIGDFVLTGGEIAAMAVADSVCRLVPGVLSDEQCYTGESHWDGLLEYPQYTRPEEWEGVKVPDVLLNGNQAKVDAWRHQQQLLRTMLKRPDMFEKLNLSEKERRYLNRRLDGQVSYRKAVFNDIHNIVNITHQAKDLLKKKGIDQWQGSYPDETTFTEDIDKEEMYVVTVDDEIGAFFVLSGNQEESYDNIQNGKWSSNLPYCVIHRTAVADKYRGTGLSDYIFKFAEEVTKQNNISYIRVDTHRKNKSMQRCLKEAGYVYRGNIDVFSEPGHETLRYAFEKRLKNKK